jgi:hypothetical protein
MKKNQSQFRSAHSAATAFDVVLGFDMETDIGSFTPFYEGVKRGTPHLLKLLKKHPRNFLLDRACSGDKSGNGPARARCRPRNRLPRALPRNAGGSAFSAAE